MYLITEYIIIYIYIYVFEWDIYIYIYIFKLWFDIYDFGQSDYVLTLVPS